MRNFLTLTATSNAVKDCAVKDRPRGETSLSDQQAHALAKLCRRVTTHDLKAVASSDDEACAMRDALARIRDMLSDASIGPQ